ncbi:pentatricopeptide repeat protein [Salvia divinorum]|uniref:Pentatricopeptide repeat protein n=1 Tax=Salvia divinorum TaxID=28513 RepID=A0ABD1I9Z7_SALDI
MLRRNITEETCSRIIYFANKQSLKDGICIHSPMLKLGLRDNLLLTNNLLSLYAKCFGSHHARHLFDELPQRDVVSWTAVLSAYVKDGSHGEALSFFDSMKKSDEKPNHFTFSNVLRSCCALGDFAHGTRVHASLIKHGFESNTVLCSSLIELYSRRRGALGDADRVFGGVANADSVCWTALISSFVQAGKWARAVGCYVCMMDDDVPPNEYAFVKLSVACGFLGIDHVKAIHSQLILWGLRMNLVLKTALVDAYTKCQRVEEALKVLKQTSEQDVQLWTTVMCGFARNMSFSDGVAAFRRMLGSNIVLRGYCYAGILNACSSSQALLLGKQIHAHVIMTGLGNDVSLGNALLDLYAKCSNAAQDVMCVFKGIALPNDESWTTLITGLAAQGLSEECCLAFQEMRVDCQQTNSFVLSSVVQACGATGSANNTGKVHGFIIKTNGDHDIAVVNALVDAYAGLQMPDRGLRLAKGTNVATYTVLASKLNRTGQHQHTLEIISRMRDDGLRIDGFVISTFLSASANLGATRTGEQLHAYAITSGFAGWISVSNGLINFYGKCRRVHEAERAFAEISQPDTVSWNALIHGFARNGDTGLALSTLDDMRLSGAKPDSVTLMTVLDICGQRGLVDMAFEYFHSLTCLYDIEPRLNHYTLLVDLLGRAGRLEEAVSMAKSMPLRPNALIYKRLLHSCRLYQNMLLAEELARKGLELDPRDLEFYDLLATIYDQGGQPELGDTMRGLIKEGGGLTKNAGWQPPLVDQRD